MLLNLGVMHFIQMSHFWPSIWADNFVDLFLYLQYNNDKTKLLGLVLVQIDQLIRKKVLVKGAVVGNLS